LCKESGLTGLYVTHDQKEALSVADRLGIMHRGQLLQVGTPREVYTRPCDAFVAEFIGETNLVTGTVAESAGNQATIRVAGGVLASRVPGTATAGQSVRLSLRPEAFHIVRHGDGDAANLLAGTVRETVYLGGMVQYTVIVPDGLELQVMELNPPELVAPGTVLRLRIAPADVVVLPA
jgi:iron(III) transport system ATP-binding protein